VSGPRKFLLAALAAGIVVRAVLIALAVLDPEIVTHSDQRIYLDLAGYLRQHLGSGEMFGAGFGAERMPLYPAFLALFGATGAGPGLWAALAVQNLIGLSAVLAVQRMGRLMSEDAGDLAAGLAALSLNMAVYANQVLTESVFLPLFAWGTLFFLRSRIKGEGTCGGMADLLAAAALMGLATLARSATMYLPLFVVPYLLLERGGRPVALRALRALAFAAVFCACLAPWALRNQAVYGHLALTSQGRPHIVGWILPAVEQQEEGVSLEEAVRRRAAAWEEIERGLPDEVRANPLALDKAVKRHALDYLSGVSPLSVAAAWTYGAVKNLFVPVTVELAYILDMDWTHFSSSPGNSAPAQAWNFLVHNESRSYVLLLAGGLVLTLALRLLQAGGAAALLGKRPEVLAAGLVLAAYFLAVSGPVGYAKYRLPFEPLLALAGGAGLERLLRRARRIRGLR